LCLRTLHHRFVAWTTPDTTSLLLGTLTDISRSKSELVEENALLRQQLIILRRQVKRPACCAGYLVYLFQKSGREQVCKYHINPWLVSRLGSTGTVSTIFGIFLNG
jgi:hypothetical protein